jgi:uncharacterized protein (TIGR00106 family)
MRFPGGVGLRRDENHRARPFWRAARFAGVTFLGRGKRMSVLIDFSMFPVDKGESVSAFVARAVKVIRESGMPHRIGPMGTTIEGEWEETIGLVGRCLEELKKDCNRVYMTLKVDYRKGPGGRIETKVKSLGNKL